MEADATAGCPVLEWDTCDMAMAEARAIHENDPDQSEEDAFEEVLKDSLYWELVWDNLTLSLSSIMEEVNPTGHWEAVGRDMGWQQLDGHKEFEASTGEEFLAALLPKCDCSFRIYRTVDTISINCAHHDSPVWKEWYHVRRRKAID